MPQPLTFTHFSAKKAKPTPAKAAPAKKATPAKKAKASPKKPKRSGGAPECSSGSMFEKDALKVSGQRKRAGNAKYDNDETLKTLHTPAAVSLCREHD
jgi:hypothetical protein